MIISTKLGGLFTRKLTMKALFILYIASTFLGLFWIGFNFNTNNVEKSSESLKKRIIQLEKNEILLKSLIKAKKSQMDSWPTIFVITPTHTRLEQKAELTRICQCLMHIPKLHWIVVEDRESKSKLVEKFLLKCKVTSTHLYARTPEENILGANESRWKKPRGVIQRNTGLNFLRVEKSDVDGVVYFADDDNVYDLELFDEMRFTKKASVWPVGLVGKLKYETPILSPQGKVKSWRTSWKPSRKFALDMAGFAVNLKLVINKPQANFNSNSHIGMLESNFLSDLGLELEDLEPKANDCREILVWHTRTEKTNLKNEAKMSSLPLDDREV